MTRPTAHPHHVSNLLRPVLEGIVIAVSDRDATDAEFKDKSADTWTVIQSFQPRDVIDLMLTGQVVGFNEAFAENLRYLLRGMTDTIRLRTQSQLLAMGRQTLAHVQELEKRGIQPYRTEIAARQPPASTAKAPEAKPPEQPKAAAPPSEPDPLPPETEPPAEETSWLDEPRPEWLLETPAMLAAETALAPDDPAPPWPAHPGDGADASWSTRAPEPDLAYSRARDMLAEAMMGAAAGE